MTLKCKDPVKVLTVRGTAFAPAEGEGSPAKEDAPAGDYKAPGTTFVAQEIKKSDRPELTAAKIIISGGMHLFILIKLSVLKNEFQD